MNPTAPVDYAEVGRWLLNFATSHGKREHPRAEAAIEMGREREGHSYGLRFALDGVTRPPAGSPPLELAFADVAEGRTRFAWCEELARRLRGEVRRLVEQQLLSRRA